MCLKILDAQKLCTQSMTVFPMSSLFDFITIKLIYSEIKLVACELSQSHQTLVIPWTVSLPGSLSMGVFCKNPGVGCRSLSPGHLPKQIKPRSLHFWQIIQH